MSGLDRESFLADKRLTMRLSETSRPSEKRPSTFPTKYGSKCLGWNGGKLSECETGSLMHTSASTLIYFNESTLS